MNNLIPISWRPRLSALLPADPQHLVGPVVTWWFTAVYLIPITVRSLIHLLSPDGGAHSIATIDISVQGGGNIVGMFGQWGAIQLLLALLLWVLLIRYRGLVPLILLILLAEPVLRDLSGTLKPIQTVGTAPGSIFNWAAVPILALMLWLSLCPVNEFNAEAQRENFNAKAQRGKGGEEKKR
jgi:hypothetical protein